MVDTFKTAGLRASLKSMTLALCAFAVALGPIKYGRVLSAICWIVLLAAPSATLADPFDGTYTGKRVITKGDDPSCPTEESVSVTIKGGTLAFTDSNAKDYAIGFDPRPDGSFGELTTTISGAVAAIRGRINGSNLDADVTTAHCQHHWHLVKQ